VLAFEQQALDQEPYKGKLRALDYIQDYALLSLVQPYCLGRIGTGSHLAMLATEASEQNDNKSKSYRAESF